MKRNRPHCRGVSLIEVCVVMTVLAVTAAMAAPSFGQLRQRLEIEGVASELDTDLRFARSEAVARSASLRIGFAADASCYIVHTGGADDCRCGDDGQPRCSGGAEALKTVHLPADRAVRLRSNARSMLFDGTAGTVSPTGTLQVIGRDGRAVHKVVSVLGRVRSCSPRRSMPGYRAC